MLPILFFVGPFGIRTGVLVVLAAVLVGTWISARRLGQRGLSPDLAWDFLIPALVSGFVGARLFHALVFDPAWYLERPLELLAVWKGGFAEEGGFLAAVVAGLWWCHRRGIDVWAFGDGVAPGVALGQALARIAALLGGSGYGTPTTLPWGVTFSDPNAAAPLGVPLHPTQAYEFLAGMLLTTLLLVAGRRAARGELVLLLLMGLALQRSLLDPVRGDAVHVTDWFTSGQAVGALVLGIALVVLARQPGRIRRRRVGPGETAA